ncbi:MAG: hypothetical protein HY647_07620 [Acidobacteria bacterium]|nr:hypothetical protein [Acidobacteriota bacterium]
MRISLCRQSHLPLAVFWFACLGSGQLLFAQEPGPAALPPGEGKDIVMTACTQCHGLQRIQMIRYGRPGWKKSVEEMVLRGAQLLPKEAETVTEYLTANFGPGSTPISTGAPPGSSSAASAVTLPAGPGKELVESHCALCHDLDRVLVMKRSRQEWNNMVKEMVKIGLQASEEELRAIVSYLSAQFGKESQ